MNIPTPSELIAEFHERVLQAWWRAWPADSSLSRTFDLCDKTIRCHFVNSTLSESILPALSHHSERAGATPHLEVYVLDGRSGAKCPLPPWHFDEGEAWQCDTPDYFGLYLPLLDSLLWLDRKLHQAFYWTPEAHRLPLAERGSPLLTLWGAWLSKSGFDLVHAAAVAGGKGAVLMLGQGGSGKSSTALSSLDSPLRYLGDDYCLVSSNPEPMVFSLYSSGKIHNVDRTYYPFLESAYSGHDEEKTLYQLVPSLSHKLSMRQPVRALLSVRVANERQTRLERISAMQAVRAVAPNTILQLRVGIDSRQTLQRLSAIAQSVECYRLHLGNDRREAAHFLAHFLDQ